MCCLELFCISLYNLPSLQSSQPVKTFLLFKCCISDLGGISLHLFLLLFASLVLGFSVLELYINITGRGALWKKMFFCCFFCMERVIIAPWHFIIGWLEIGSSAYIESSRSHCSLLVPISLSLGIWNFVCIINSQQQMTQVLFTEDFWHHQISSQKVYTKVWQSLAFTP